MRALPIVLAACDPLSDHLPVWADVVVADLPRHPWVTAPR